MLYAGPFDIIGILKDTSTGRFHACHWQDRPLPGNPDLSFRRLKSLRHHATGAATFEEALADVAKLRAVISIDDANVWLREDQVIERHFPSQDPASVLVVARNK
jgi:hypothetical protein